MSNSTVFRLGDLSEVTSKLVISKMNMVDLFDLSLCSTKAKRTVRNATSRYSKLDFLISNESANLTVHMDPSDVRNRYRKALFWAWPRREQWPEQFSGMKRVVEGHPIFCEHVDGPAGILSSKSESWPTEMEAVFKHLQEIFPFSLDNIWISVDESYSSELIRKTLGEFPKKCKNLTVEGAVDGEFGPSDYEFFAVEMEVSGKLHLCLEPSPEIRIPETRVFRCETLGICCSFWFTKEHLMSSDCVDIKLHKSKLHLKDLYDFVRKWAESGDQRFTTLHCEFLESNEHSELSNDLETGEWKETERSAYYRLKSEYSYDDKRMNCSKGVDIHRADGKLATVLVKSNYFDFVVWHERFHDTEGLMHVIPSRRYNY